MTICLWYSKTDNYKYRQLFEKKDSSPKLFIIYAELEDGSIRSLTVEEKPHGEGISKLALSISLKKLLNQ